MIHTNFIIPSIFWFSNAFLQGRIASFNIGHKILFDTKPGESLQDRAILPIFRRLYYRRICCFACLITINNFCSFIIGTGFMKCIPMTFSGRLVALAMVEIEIDEVLEARTSGLQISSNSENIDVFKSK